MEIQANGNISQKNKQKHWKWKYFLSNETVFSTKTLQTLENGNSKSCNFFLEQMGIFPEKTNEKVENGIPFARECTVNERYLGVFCGLTPLDVFESSDVTYFMPTPRWRKTTYLCIEPKKKTCHMVEETCFLFLDFQNFASKYIFFIEIPLSW